jgi:zinc D-Ala-D-Ala carboxypeptidase
VNLTTHFTLEELTHSDVALRRGIDNMPSAEIVANLQTLAEGLEKLRSLLGTPILINSGYRCLDLNRLIGGALRSQHMEGRAADFVSPDKGPPVEVCRQIAGSDVPFDQLIYEYTWCHVSFRSEPRHSILTLDRATGGYLNGIVA